MKLNNNYKILDHNNFYEYASKYYKNNCGLSLYEYNLDIRRIEFINNIFARWEDKNKLNVPKLRNIIVIAFNIFDRASVDVLYFLTKPEYHDYLTATLWVFGILDETHEFVQSFGINNDIVETIIDYKEE